MLGRGNDETRRQAVSIVESELDRLSRLRPQDVRALVPESPREATRDGLGVTTCVRAEGERLMVLVEVWRGRRMFATGGFAMAADGSVHTPD